MSDIGAQFRKCKIINGRSLVNEQNSFRMVEGSQATRFLFKLVIRRTSYH